MVGSTPSRTWLNEQRKPDWLKPPSQQPPVRPLGELVIGQSNLGSLLKSGCMKKESSPTNHVELALGSPDGFAAWRHKDPAYPPRLAESRSIRGSLPERW